MEWPALGKVGRTSEGTGWSTWLGFKRWIRVHQVERKRHRHVELTNSHVWLQKREVWEPVAGEAREGTVKCRET